MIKKIVEYEGDKYAVEITDNGDHTMSVDVNGCVTIFGDEVEGTRHYDGSLTDYAINLAIEEYLHTLVDSETGLRYGETEPQPEFSFYDDKIGE